MLEAVTSWPDVEIALVAGLSGIIAAVAALRVHRAVRTPSGTSIGRQVENVQHTALSNYYRLHSLTKGLDVPVPVEAEREDEQINGVTHRRADDQ